MKDTERNWQVWMEVGMAEENVDIFFFFNVGHMFRGCHEILHYLMRYMPKGKEDGSSQYNPTL